MTFVKWLQYVLGTPLTQSGIAADSVALDDSALGHIREELDDLRTKATATEQRLVALERRQQHEQSWLPKKPIKEDK
jgi:hypothetical protein